MSDDDVERFEITDYDLAHEFNHRRKKLSKNQQIYGVWADDSDDEGDGNDNGFPRRSFKSSQSKNYSAPIGFVAGGVQQSGKDKNKVKNVEDEEDDDAEKGESSSTIYLASSSSDEEGMGGRPGFGSKSVGTNRRSTAEIAGFRTKNAASSVSGQGMGHWERHTKGIGAKLLLQMGFQPGRGLGKDLQGIAAPVEAHLRKGRGAIGAYGPEKPATIPLPKDKRDTSKKYEENLENRQSDSKWKKSDVGKRKVRYYYKTVDDVIEKGDKLQGYHNSNDMSNVKVIDMTGPNQRVLSGYHALSGLKAPSGVEHFEDVVHKKCTNFALPELQHNLNLLVNMCEQDIIRIDRNNRQNDCHLEELKQEQEQLQQTVYNEDKLVKTLTDVMQVVDELLDPTQNLSLKQIASIFIDLQRNHMDEYVRYELGELAPGLVGPLLTSAMANWSPLGTPRQFVDVFTQWKTILDVSKHRGALEGNNTMGIQPYDSLLWHTWMPVIRNCVRSWNPRYCDPLINFIEIWTPVTSVWMMAYVYDQIVIPRILNEVNAWDPLTDIVPIHVWIHPWMPLLDTKLQVTIYPIIQEKLGVALTNWHPYDQSAKDILAPWKRVLSEGVFTAFLIKHIVPKLQMCMQSFVINPHQQHLDAWHWVMRWNDMLPLPTMTLLLDKFFFPRWRQTLALWLNHNPNYKQVTEWYYGWKSMLSDDLLAQPTIKENFHMALEIMSQAVDLVQQVGAKESISYLNSMEGQRPVPLPPPAPPSVISDSIRNLSKVPPLYKDLVAKCCEERGILFVPIVNKYREAKQVYKIGNNGVQCYIDKNVIFATQQNNDKWIPTSINRLLDMA